MASDVSLIFNLLAKDKATGTIGKVEKGIGRMGVAVAGMAVGVGVGLAKVGGDFHEAFSTIRVGTGATGDQLDGLEDSFKNVAATVPNAIGDTATVLADFNTLTGATGEDLELLTQTFLNMERITGESVGIEKITRVFGDWGVETKDQAATMDELFRVSQTTGIGIDQLATSVVQFGAPLRGVGFTLEESAALMGKWEKEGVNMETIMSGLRTATGKWAKDAKDPAKALDQTISKMQGMTDQGEIMSLAIETFGSRAGPDMAAAIMEGRFEIDELMATLSGNEDTINGLASETETWQDKLARLKNEGLVAVEPAATAVFDGLSKGVGILKSVSVWAQNNTGTVKALAIALGVVAATILAVNIGIKIFHAAMMVKAGIIAVVTAAQWLWNVAMMANPIGLIIIAIVAVVAALVLLYTKSETARRIMDAVFQAIVAAAKWWWENIVKRYIAAVVAGFKFVIAWARNLWRGIQLYFGFWKGMLAKVIGWVTNVWTSARDRFNKIVGFVRKLPSRISSATSGMWNGIKDSFRAAINWVIGAWNGLSFTLPSVTVFGKTVGGMTLSTPNIPHLATGGIITGPTLALLGEGGHDEAVIPLPRGMRPGDGAALGRDLPDEFVCEATIDLGDGITKKVQLLMKRKAKDARRNTLQGAGAGR